jgi:hypothetical protein
MRIVVLTSGNLLDFSPEISLDHVFHLSPGSCCHIDSKLIEEIDGRWSHSACDHHVCILGTNELRDDPGLVVRIMRVPYDLKSQDMIARDIHEHIKGASTKVRTEYGFETESRLAS